MEEEEEEEKEREEEEEEVGTEARVQGDFRPQNWVRRR